MADSTPPLRAYEGEQISNRLDDTYHSAKGIRPSPLIRSRQIRWVRFADIFNDFTALFRPMELVGVRLVLSQRYEPHHKSHA